MLAPKRIQIIFLDVSMLRIHHQQRHRRLRTVPFNLETLQYRVYAQYLQKQKTHLHRIQLIMPPATSQRKKIGVVR
jgi:hypothetical protein